jgi:hypothetical protein
MSVWRSVCLSTVGQQGSGTPLQCGTLFALNMTHVTVTKSRTTHVPAALEARFRAKVRSVCEKMFFKSNVCSGYEVASGGSASVSGAMVTNS